MRFLSVATFCHPDHFGGAERVIGAVARGLVERGHDVTLLTGRLPGTAERETRDGVRVHRYALRTGSPGRFARSVWSGVRAALRAGVGREADVLHVHQLFSGVAALAPGVPRPAATLASFYAPYHLEYLARFREGRPEGTVPPRARATAALLARGDRLLLRRARAVLVLSSFSRAQALQLLPSCAGRLRTAPAGIDLQRFRPAHDDAERAAARQLLGLDHDGPPLLLSVRRLVPRMGLPDLVDALAALHRLGRPARLAVAGEGPEREALLARARVAGVADAVRLLGRVPEERLPALYRAADVFVLPTRSLEGYGMATIEALASGVPVVATDVGASAEVLAGVPGSRLVPPGRPDELAAALAGLLAEPSALREAGRAARLHAEAHLGWEHHLDAVEAAAREAQGDAA